MSIQYQTAKLSSLRDSLIQLDLDDPHESLCREIEKQVADLLLAGAVDGIKQIMLEIQEAWGTLPAKRSRDGVRFFPAINPIGLLVGCDQVKVLKTLNKNYFGFTAAGMALDVPGALFGKREGYLESVQLSDALIAEKGAFGAFRCKTPGEVGAFLQLMSNETQSPNDCWEFLEKGEVDFTHYKAWGHAEKINFYAARDGLWTASGFGREWVSGKISAPTQLSDVEKNARSILLKALRGIAAVSLIVSMQTFHRKEFGSYKGMTGTYERIIEELNRTEEVPVETLRKLVAKAAISTITLSADPMIELKAATIDWFGKEAMEKMYPADILSNLYSNTKSTALLSYAKTDRDVEDHMMRDLGL